MANVHGSFFYPERNLRKYFGRQAQGPRIRIFPGLGWVGMGNKSKSLFISAGAGARSEIGNNGIPNEIWLISHSQSQQALTPM